MNEYPLITSFVLTYKNYDNVYSTVDSILNQDYPAIEIGVFDDGSASFPKEEIISYIESRKRPNIKRVVVHSNDINQGTVKNINIALRMTSGKYIISIACDDTFFDNSSCSKIVDFFEKTDADIVTSYREVVDSEDNKLGYSPSRRSANRLKKTNAEEQYKWISSGAPIAGAGTYYSRRILNMFGGFDEEYFLQEDGPFFLKATRSGIRIHFMESITFKYKLGNGVSSSANSNPILVKDVNLLIKKEIIPYFSVFNILEKRRVKYEMERINLNKQLKIKEKLLLFFRYPDVIVFRLFYSH